MSVKWQSYCEVVVVNIECLDDAGLATELKNIREEIKHIVFTGITTDGYMQYKVICVDNGIGF